MDYRRVSSGIFIVFLALAYAIRIPHLRRRKKIKEDRTTSLEWLILPMSFIGMQVMPVIYFASGSLAFADYIPPAPLGFAMMIAGAVISATSLWLLWRSHRDLGMNWSNRVLIREGQTLITEGIYAHIRHPIYAAHWLWTFAQALLIWNWMAGFAGIIAFAPVYFNRVPREEDMMTSHFGDDYREYMSRTGRILPRLK